MDRIIYEPTYYIFAEQPRLRRVCANAQTRLSLCCLYKQSMEVEEDSEPRPPPPPKKKSLAQMETLA